MSHRVLVVEDDPDIQGYSKTLLESAGLTVYACGTVEEARRLYLKHPPDLVILDISLPDGSGLDLMKEWQGMPGGSSPVLFLTARAEMEMRLEAFRSGAQDYVVKPFGAQELLARARVHLNIRRSHEELAKRNYELELIARARQDMADMIVHDLKAPLCSIKGTLELIKMHGLINHKTYSNLVENADTAADFMLLMLNDLLDVAQARQAALKTEIVPLDMRLLFEKLRVLFAGRCRAREVELLGQIDKDAALLHSDQNLLYRILANLIANAIKVSKAGSHVEFRCQKDRGMMRMTVLDRGPGVADADKLKIFEKYSTTRRADPELEAGTGIGLAFCRVATQALGGKVWVEDRDGGGSRFIVELPWNPPSR